MSQKILSLLTIFFIVNSTLYCQTDPISIEQTTENKEQNSFSSTKKYKYLDRNFIEEKSLWRFGSYYGLSLSYERKLTLSSAVYAGVHGDYPFWENNQTRGFFAGYKYFYSSKKKIKENKKANNLNGVFVGTEYHRVFSKDKEFYNYHRPYPEHSFNLIWGIQQRVGRYGAVGAGLNLMLVPNSSHWFEFNSRFNIGLAIGNRRKNQKLETPYNEYLSNKISNLTGQLTEDKSFIKFGIEQFNADANGYFLDGIVAYERKILPTLSIIGEADYTSSYGELTSGLIPLNYNINVGFRYYYSLNKRIRRGLSANNFSANYISLMALNIGQGTVYLNDERPYNNYRLPPDDRGIGLFWGMQRKIGKAGFIDFQLGVSLRERNYRSISYWPDPQNPTITRRTWYEFNPEIRLTYGFGK